MDNLDELKTIYEDLKKESLKDQEENLEIDLENNNILSEKDISTINEFLKDSGNVQDLNNFISAFNMQDLINSKFYQKNKGFHFFEDFISFENIKFKCLKNFKENNGFLKHFNSIDLIPNKNEIQELLNDSSLNIHKNKKKTPNDLKIIELIESDNKIKIISSNENLNKFQKQNKPDSETNLSPKKYSKEKNKDNLGFEKIEINKGIYYKYNAIDFMKYTLYLSSLKNEVAIPGLFSIQFSDELLKNAEVTNLEIKKGPVKFDLVIKNMSKEDIEKFFNNIKKNVFQKEKLDFDSKKIHNFDLLIKIEENFFYQSQDEYTQINTYVLIIKILNYLKEIDGEDGNYLDYKNLNKLICNKLKVTENNEKILILVTNHLLNQKIQFSNKDRFEDIEKNETKEEGIDNVDFDKETYKILSNLIEDISISKIFSFIQNEGNIQNLNKILNILSYLDKSNIKYSIIYFEDDIKISLENYILNEIMFQVNYNHTEFKRFHENYKKILIRVYRLKITYRIIYYLLVLEKVKKLFVAT